jgi:hypothetical protein
MDIGKLLESILPYLVGGGVGLAIDNNNAGNYVDPKAPGQRAAGMTQNANDLLQNILAGRGTNSNLAASQSRVSSMPQMNYSGRVPSAINTQLMGAASGNFGTASQKNAPLMDMLTQSLKNRNTPRAPIVR